MCWVNAGFFCVHLILRFRAKKQRKKEMEDNFKIIDSEQGDVVIDFGNKTFKLSLLVSLMTEIILNKKLEELNNKLRDHGSGKLPSYDESYWSSAGVDCQILKPSKNWQKGKIRMKISLEFCPEEPESPLDDLRRR
jgi:hypothetical protein